MVALRKTDYQHPDYRQQALDLIEYATKRTNIITFPTAFLGLLDYQHTAAILLNQILYWSSRTSDPEGWFYKSDDQWTAEIGLSRYQVEKALYGDARTKKQRLTLSEIGVHKVTRRNPKGDPVSHYRIDMPIFIAYLEAYLFQQEAVELPDETEADENEQCDTSFCNNVAEGNATESQNEMQQSDISSIDKDSPSVKESKSLSNPVDERFSLYKSFERPFGKLEKLSNATHTELLEQLTRLGTRTTLDVAQRCTAYGSSWHYVLTALKNECSATVSQNSAAWLNEMLAEDMFGSDDDVSETETSEKPIIDFRELLRRPPAPRRGDPIPTERIKMCANERSSFENVAAMWSAAKQQLELQNDYAFANNCLRYLTLVDYEPETRCFVLVADNQIALDETLRRPRTITRMLTSALGAEATFRTVRKEAWATVQ